eukprot:TRINITY_DN2762_c0_g1_i2.p1 TRINITY_DN2762_c0_g1~~TRINITY_DN2762_c0_g1_i2.p1  ORF type:complete len:770 (+),score=117.65 TRINITY_DN2762_c0_g1_i2:2-2311(+)
MAGPCRSLHDLEERENNRASVGPLSPSPAQRRKSAKRWSKVPSLGPKSQRTYEALMNKQIGKTENVEQQNVMQTSIHVSGLSFSDTTRPVPSAEETKTSTTPKEKNSPLTSSSRLEKSNSAKRLSTFYDRDWKKEQLLRGEMVQQLWIKVYSVKNIFKKGPRDVYCKLIVGNQILKTSTINKQNDLIWNETIIFFLDDTSMLDLMIEVYEEEFLGKHNLVGACILELSQLQFSVTQDHQLELKNTTGTISFQTLSRTFTENNSNTDVYGFPLTPDLKQEYIDWLYTHKRKSEEKLKDWLKLQWLKIKPSDLKTIARKGIPKEYRGEMWQTFSGSKNLLRKNEDYYTFTLKEHIDEITVHTVQIDKDLDRTFPGHELYQTAEGKESLRRVLIAFSWKNHSVGYCQSMNFICAMLLFFLNEESVFWLLAIITEELVPDYFNMKMFGAKADILVFKDVSAEKIPQIVKHLNSLDIEVSHIIAQWFLCLYVGYLPTETVLRVFDAFLIEGSSVLIRVALALFKINEPEILECTDFDELFQILKKMPSRTFNCDKLMKVAFKEFGYLPAAKLRSLRQKHYKIIEENSTSKTLEELTKTTDFTLTELEALSYQYNSIVQTTPDNKNRLMDRSTFFKLFEGMFRVSYPEKTEKQGYQLIHLIFHALDQNSDKHIEFQDFITALYILKRGSHSQKIQLVFRAVDTDKNGVLDRSELKKLLELQDLFPMDDDSIELLLQKYLPSENDRMKFPAFTELIENNQTLLTWLLQSTTLFDSS